jgi:NTE family protein
MRAILKPDRKIGVVFSSGFFGFFAHAGFLAALRNAGIKPSSWAGSSSGAIVAAMAASGMDDDAIRDYLFKLRLEDFWDPDPWWQVAGRGLRGFKGFSGYLKGEGFARLMEILPARTFEECPWPLAIAATNLTNRRETIFTRGRLAGAVCASGAVPMLFRPVELDGCLYADGGVTSKAPIMGLLSVARPDVIIIHYIASRNIEHRGNDFLKKIFTPWFIQDTAFDIARFESYGYQKALAEKMGVELIEIQTNAPHVGPKSLDRGPAAYGQARLETLRSLGMEP